MKYLLALLAFILGAVAIARGQETVKDNEGKSYPLGRVAPSAQRLQQVFRDSNQKHAYKFKMLSTRAVPESFDLEAFGLVPFVKSQEDCGSCHIFSACGPVNSANIKAGNLKLSADGASEQWMLDCKNTGGCNGGWEWDNAEMILKGGGIPLESEYGPYTARSRQCKSISGMKMLKISDMGMCSSFDGVAKTIDIQNAMIEYGEISVAVAADNAFASYRGGLFNGSGSRSVNHAVVLSGWKTVNGNVYWKLRNSWGTSWGEKGFMWIKAGANQVGIEAFWVKADSIAPPVPPDPDPPGPGPLPPGAKVISLRGFGVNDGEYRVINMDMPLRDILEAVKTGTAVVGPSGVTSKPCADKQRLDDLEKTNKVLVEAILKIQEVLAGKKEIGSAPEKPTLPPTLKKTTKLWSEMSQAEQAMWWDRHLPGIDRSRVRSDKWWNENYHTWEVSKP